MPRTSSALIVIVVAAACSHSAGKPTASKAAALENVTCPTPAEAEAAQPTGLDKVNPAQLGALEGQFDVSSRGSATYAIPLVAPPGRAGVEPHLSVGYDSSAGEGTLGMGFSLQGLSSIARCGSNYAQDYDLRAVKYDVGDHFCLDGVRLVPIAEGANGSIEYRTFPDQFSKVIAKFDAGWDHAKGPTWFQVWSKSGRVLEYGEREEGRALVAGGVVSAWWVTEERDRRMNAIEYHYANELDADGHTLRFYPDHIDYTEHPSAPATRRVRFEYGSWSAHPDAYTDGVRVMRDRRITRVKMLLLGDDREEPVRVYRFSYTANPASGRALVTQVTECANDDPTTCKPPTKLGWLTNAGGSLGAATTIVDGVGGGLIDDLNHVEDVIGADVNGDGLQDLVFDATPSGSIVNNVMVALNMGSDTYAPPAVWEEGGDIGPRAMVLDYNLDGLDDLLVDRDTWTVLQSTGSAFEEIDTGFSTYNQVVDIEPGPACVECVTDEYGQTSCTTYPTTVTITTTRSVLRQHVLDLNGDGISDLADCQEEVVCVSTQGCNGFPGTYSCPSHTDTWSIRMGTILGLSDPATTPLPLAEKACVSDVKFVDVQGDGKVDILVPHSGFFSLTDPGEYPPMCGDSPCTYQVVEFDPLGAPVPGLTPEGDWIATDSGLTMHRFSESTLFIDVNGDGLVDAVQSDLGSLKTFLNTGDGFADAIASIDWPAVLAALAPPHPPGVMPWSHAILDFQEAMPIDYDGDGNMDFVASVAPMDDVTVIPAFDEVRWVVFRASQSGDGTFQAVDLGIYTSDEQGLRVTDAQGDGRQDVITHDDHDVFLRVNTGRHGLLASITDGMNALDPGDPGFVPNVAITYGNLVDRAIQQGWPDGSIEEEETGYVSNWLLQPNSCFYPRACVVGAWPVVRQYSLANGVGGARTSDVRYRNGRYDKLGRGWLGFGAVIARDDDTQGAAASFYDNIHYDAAHRVYPFVGQVTQQWTWAPALPGQPDPTQIVVTYADVDNVATPTNAGASYYTLAEQTDVRRFEGDYAPGPTTILQFVRDEESNAADQVSQTRHQIDSVDDFGNVLGEQVETVGVEKTATTRTFFTDEASWLVGLLDSEQVCSTIDGEMQCRNRDPQNNGYGEVIADSIGDPADPQTQLSRGFDHDAFGNVTTQWADDAYGHHRSSCTTYDTNGIYPIASRNALGYTDYYRYEPGLGTVTAAKDANGLVTRWRVDGFGRELEEQRADGTSTVVSRVRSKDGGPLANEWNIKVTSDTTGGALNLTRFDMLGRVVSEQTRGPSIQACEEGVCTADPEYIHTFTYDELGRVRAATQPYLTVALAPHPQTTFEYDALGRATTITSPWGATHSFAYDRLTTSDTDSAGTATTERDASGRPSKIWDKRGTSTDYAYAPFGLLRDVDVDGTHTTWVRDAYGRVRSEDDPDRGHTERSYDGFGELLTETDALDRQVKQTYDELGRLVERETSDGITTWSYDLTDCLGCLTSIDGPDGVVESFGYDGLTRPISAELDVAGDAISSSLEYDALGRPFRVTYPEDVTGVSPVVEYGYDARGYVLEVADVASGLQYWKVNRVDGTGRYALQTLGNGVTMQRDYLHDKGTVARIHTWRGGMEIQDLSYAYDDRLNVEIRHDDIQGAEELFQYDELDRLWCASSSSKDPCSLELTYEDNGNIREKSDVGTYAYDPEHPHAVVGAGPWTYRYDAVGNQIGRPGVELIDYTAFNLPRRYVLDGGDEVLYEYDGELRRVRKTTAVSDTLYVGGIYERETALPGMSVKERYNIPAGDGMVVLTRVAGEPDEIDYVNTDALGSTDVITDKFGVVKERHSFDAFGARRNPDDWSDPTPGSASKVTPFAFTGQEDEDDLGLVNMVGRIYDPKLARFLQVDPINTDPSFSQRWNSYSYVLNNPLRYTDPSGYADVSGATEENEEPVDFSATITEYPESSDEAGPVLTIEIVIGPPGDEAQPPPQASTTSTMTAEEEDFLRRTRYALKGYQIAKPTVEPQYEPPPVDDYKDPVLRPEDAPGSFEVYKNRGERTSFPSGTEAMTHLGGGEPLPGIAGGSYDEPTGGLPAVRTVVLAPPAQGTEPVAPRAPTSPVKLPDREDGVFAGTASGVLTRAGFDNPGAVRMVLSQLYAQNTVRRTPMDWGIPGLWCASHAELQSLLLARGEIVWVNELMCSNCIRGARGMAMWRFQTQIVIDPEFVRIFSPSGAIGVARRVDLPAVEEAESETMP